MKNKFKILYYFSIGVFSIIGAIINVYYEYSTLKYLLPSSLFLFIIIELYRNKFNALLYFLLQFCLVFIIIIPFSLEFFIPILEINNYRGLERVIFSPIVVYPILLTIIIIYWTRLIIKYKSHKSQP